MKINYKDMRKENIDISAPIIPGESIGGIPLYSHIRDYRDLVNSFEYCEKKTGKDLSHSFFGTFEIAYEYKDIMTLVFSIINGKLLIIIAQKGYNGLLFDKIRVGMNIKEAMKLEPRIYFDNVHEEYYLVKGEKGIMLETDPATGNIAVIMVNIKEMDEIEDDKGNASFEKSEEFNKGNW